MRGHESRGSVLGGQAPRVTEGRRAPARTPDTIRMLQQSAGNAAVCAQLARLPVWQPGDEQQVPAGPTSPGALAVQRTVHDVLRSAGRPLASAVRTEMEGRLGAGFAGVRVHDDAEAARSAAGIGARAYTCGEHVVLGPLGRDRHTLAHELTHVIQQRSGPVAGHRHAGGLSISDPDDRFERAAEATADRVMRADVGVEPPSRLDPDTRAARAPSTGPDPGAVQRRVVVGGDVFSDRRQPAPSQPAVTAAGEALRLMRLVVPAINGSGDDRLIEQFRANRAAVGRQALKWVSDSAVGQRDQGHHPVHGRKRQDRVYSPIEGYLNVGRALVGWVLQKPGRHEEKQYATDLVNDPGFQADLDEVLAKVRVWIDRLIRDPGRMAPGTAGGLGEAELLTRKWKILDQLHTGQADPEWPGAEASFGPYQRHLHSRVRLGFGADFLTVLNDPAKYTVRDKMIVLHDVYDYFRPHTPGRGPRTAGMGILPSEPDESLLNSSQQMNPDGTRARADFDRGSSRTVRNERAASTVMARENRIPVWAGQSFTTARLLHLAREAGATPEELNAVALGIFSFWRLDYDHTVELAAHTLHEVLDIAANFGVPYNMKAPQHGSRRYPGVALRRAERANSKLADQLGPLRNAVTALETDHRSRPFGGLQRRERRVEANRLLAAFEARLGQCAQSLTTATNAPAGQLGPLAEAYAQHLREALHLYDALCTVVKAKRFQDLLSENDRDGMGSPRVPVG